MRRLFSTLLAFALLANLAAWPSAALAEALEHQQEQVNLADPAGAPAEPQGAHCHHGCAGHCGQHFQGQIGNVVSATSDTGAEKPAPAFCTSHLQPKIVPPFRPPLAVTIQS